MQHGKAPHSSQTQSVVYHAEMAQDRDHEQALQVTADSLVTEQHALQKRLQQLTLQYEADVEEVQQLQSGGPMCCCYAQADAQALYSFLQCAHVSPLKNSHWHSSQCTRSFPTAPQDEHRPAVESEQ